MREQVRNEAGNEANSITVGLPQVRSSLLALRAEHGHDSPIGHRCSNVLEQLENFVRTYDPDQRRRLDTEIMRQMAELEKLLSDCRGNRR